MKYTKEELDKLIEQAPKNEKGRPVISDEDFLDNYRELPNGVQSVGGKLSSSTGYVKLLQPGSQRTREIAKCGGDKAAETYARRKTFAESFTVFLNVKDENGESMQDKIVKAMAGKAMEGCVGAYEAIRDTVGEKPSDQVSLDIMSDADRELIENLKKRIDEQPK